MEGPAFRFREQPGKGGSHRREKGCGGKGGGRRSRLPESSSRLPERRGELAALFAELNALETPEAQLFKALDRIEAVIQHNEAPLSTWIERERTLNLEYGVEDCARFPFMAQLREIAAEETRQKLSRGE